MTDENNRDRIKREVLRHVERIGQGISFVELERIEGFAGGHECIHMRGFENLIVWTGLTPDGADVIRDLLDSEVIKATPTAPLVYFIDGKVPGYPVAKARRHYKKPRWVPVCLGKGTRWGKAAQASV